MSKKNKIKDVYEFDDSRKIKDSILFKRLIKYAKGYLVHFIFIILSVLVSSFRSNTQRAWTEPTSWF